MNAHSVRWSMLGIAFFCCDPSPATSQSSNLNVEQISVAQGLSSSEVHCILHDSRGFLWVATADGLNRYDGYGFTVFRPDQADSNSLSSEWTDVLHEDSHGALWINAASNLNRFDRITGKFVRCLKGKWVTAMCEDTSQDSSEGAMWIGSYGQGLHRYDRPTESFTTYRHESTGQNSISSDSVISLLVDRHKTLWIGTANGLNSLDLVRQHFARYQQGPAGHVNDVYEDPDTSDGSIWICADDGFYSYDRAKQIFSRYRNTLGHAAIGNDNNALAVHADSKRRIWVGMRGGIGRFDRFSGQFVAYQNDIHLDPWGHVDKAWFVKEDRAGTLLMAGDGLKKYDGTKNFWREMLFPQYHVLTLHEDRTGTIWLGTESGGLLKMDPAQKQFKYFTNLPSDPTALNQLVVNGICEDALGKVWVATPSGLDRLDLASGIFTRNVAGHRNALNPIADAVMAVREDGKGTMWVATYFDGIGEFDRATGRYILRNKHPQNPLNVIDQGVTALYSAGDGTLWATTRSGVLEEYHPESNTFRYHFPDYGTVARGDVQTIFEDSRGVIWFGGLGCGLNSYDRRTDKLEHYFNVGNPNPATGDQPRNNGSIQAINEDLKGGLWIGTRVGLYKFDRTTGAFTSFNVRNGLANDNIGGILEDEHSCLWIGTANGISRFEPKTATFRNYDAGDGIKFGRCLTSFKTRKGIMIFGGTHGFVRFHPDSIRDNPNVPPIVLTSFKIFDRPAPLDTVISEKKAIQLTHRENVFSIEFAALNFTNPEKNQYAYMLEPFDKDWVYCGTRRYASYTNLSAGTYLFHVKGSNNDGVWNDQGISLTITITPPFWKTWWAYTIYALFVVGILYSIRRYELSRQRLKFGYELEKVESTRLKELDSLKSHFFANISHEFRTPLTLILGPIEKWKSRTPEEGLSHDLGLMERNARRLLRLINQLLDLSKIEAGRMKLQAAPGNIVAFARGVGESFRSSSGGTGITLNVVAAEEEIEAYFDRDKMEKILTNLLSNALKFTPEGGRITVRISSTSEPALAEVESHQAGKDVGTLEIVLTDTGIGIAEDKVRHIFDRFYQVDSSVTREQEGTGIGLALARELVELHHGTISVESELGKGTTFTVRLPLGRSHLRPDEISDSSIATYEGPLLVEDHPDVSHPHEAVAPASEGGGPLVLIVEDNTDVRTYIRDFLVPAYRVFEALDGVVGVEMARESIPDLIISDVMMPQMDGYELCRTLKLDEKTSHIPIILLTAKAGQENKIEGLEIGADDFVTKPFDAKELLARMKNLIGQRRKLRERFSAAQVLKPGEITVSSLDDQFLQKVMRVVEGCLGDESFSVEELARDVSMSRSQLHRKLTAVTGLSPSDFIRYMRLHRAMDLLKKNSGTVSEIAYAVGFGGVSYFTKCFREQFEILPSDVRKS